MKKYLVLALFIVVGSILQTPLHAVEGLSIKSIDGNAVLSWSSVEGQTYLIRFRTSLNTNTSSWQTLTNGFPAANSTNTTSFVHFNQMPLSGGVVTDASIASVSSLNMLESPTQTESLLPLSEEAPDIIMPPLPQGMLESSGAMHYMSQAAEIPPLDEPPDSTNATIESVSAPTCGFYQVVKDGLHLYGITNGTVLSGRVPIRFEYASLDTNRTITQIFLSDNNNEGSVRGSLFNGVSGCWDTTSVTNGNYVIQLGATLDDGSVIMDDPITVTVYNAIWFPDPWQVAGYGMYIGAQTICPNGSYRLVLYDDKGIYFGYFDGPIDANGYLSYPGNTGTGFSFNNTDANGNVLPYDFMTIVYSVYPSAGLSGGPPYTLTNTIPFEKPWNFYTYGVVAYENLFSPDNIGWDEVRLLMEEILPIVGIWHNTGWANYQNNNGLNDLNSSTQWSVLTNDLKDVSYRDFVYLGHGSLTALGWEASLKVKDVETFLLNNPVDVYKGYNYHPYRFVFLDGCQTAEGNWAQAFGIPKVQHMKISDFTNKRGLRPRAFIGWNKSKAFSLLNNASLFMDHASFISEFWKTWNPRPGEQPITTLSAAIKAAKDSSTPITYIGLTLYGAEDLTIDK